MKTQNSPQCTQDSQIKTLLKRFGIYVMHLYSSVNERSLIWNSIFKPQLLD